jgi:PiT family inorganic phosphate transporter
MHFFETLEHFFPVNYGALPWVVLALILLALVFDFLNGLHDAANSIATVVSTRVLTPQQAVLWAAFFNFIAFMVFELKVADTIGKGIIHPQFVTNGVIAGTLLGACAWNILTWYWGLPTSSSHALIGGFIGAGLAHVGPSALAWTDGILRTCVFIIVAPTIGLFMGLGIAIAVYWIFQHARPRNVDSIFRRGQLVSAALYSLGHGGNDAQKTMGVIFVLMIAAVQANSNASEQIPWRDRFSINDRAIDMMTKGPEKQRVPNEVVDKLQPIKDTPFTTLGEFKSELARLLPSASRESYEARIIKAADHATVPTEMVLACHLAMGIGTLMGGWRIVKTMGQRIIRLRPVDGFCAESGAAFTLVLTIIFGIPVSTTHTITGSIVGVGSVQRWSAVRWGVAGRVVWAWIFTIPGAAIVSALCVYLFNWLASQVG